MKRIIIISLLLLVLSISAVSADENLTDNIQNETQIKQDLNVTIDYTDYILEPTETDWEYYVQFKDVPSDYNERVSVYVDDNFTFTMDPHDSMDGYFSIYGYGSHILKASFPESPKYNPVNLTHTFEVTSGYITMPKQTNVGTGSVALYLKAGATGYLSVRVDGRDFKKVAVKTDMDSYAYVSLAGLEAGTYSIEATYTGDANNAKITKRQTVKIIKDIDITTFHPSWNHFNNYKNSENIFEVYLPEDVNAKPLVSIEGIYYDAVKGDDGCFYADISTHIPGKHVVNVTYPGDDKYPRKTVFKEITIVSEIEAHVGEYGDSYFYLYLPQNAAGNLTVHVNGKFYESQRIANGLANISLKNMTVGKTYNLSAQYTSDDWNVPNVTMKITMAPRITYPAAINYGENAKIDIYMDSNQNGTLTLQKGNEKEKTLPLKDGHASTVRSDLDITQSSTSNRIKVRYVSGNYTFTKTIQTFVYPIKARLVNAKDITMYCGDSKTFSVKLYDNRGEITEKLKVTIKIGDKTYTRYTDRNGVVKLKISEAPGNYRITASYQRFSNMWGYSIGKYDADYTPISVSKKLTVKHVVTLKGTTVKKSAKKLVLQATLKNTKPLKNKQVTFKFNGKTYKAKTNSKGVAKVTIKSSVLKKLKAGKKVTYQATYLKDTVKKTVKVRK